MKQARYGLLLFIFLILPPVSNLLGSVMIIHMHMPLLVFAGFLMAYFFQIRFKGFFEKWNSNGTPGIVLFVIIWFYWMIPRMMDEAIAMQTVEWGSLAMAVCLIIYFIQVTFGDRSEYE